MARPRRRSCSTRSRSGAHHPARRLIFSLGIRHVGEQTAKTLARAYGDWAAVHEAALAIANGDEAAREEMDALDDIGDGGGRFHRRAISTSRTISGWWTG
jgi:NAD-dependent DNA ligase